MKTLNLILLAVVAFALTATAQITNVTTSTPTLTNTTTSSGWITIPGVGTNMAYSVTFSNNVVYGDLLPIAFGKVNANFSFVESQITSAQTNPPVFTAAATASTNPPSVTLTGVTNGVAYYIVTIPAGSTGATGATGAPGTNYVTMTLLTNCVFTSTESTLTNVNPLTCNGSNYIGYFSQLYDFALVTPNTSVGMTLATNLNENLYASYDNTNWFQVTNSPCVLTNPVYVTVAGDNNTNYSGSLTLYSVDHPELYGRTNNFAGQRMQFADPILPLDAVNLETAQYLIANAVGSIWSTSVDTNGTVHYSYAPQGQLNFDLTANKTTYSPFVQILNSGTNWVLGVTNLNVGYQMQFSTNLTYTYGWTTFTGYTSTTNIYNATNVVTFTVPKYLLNSAPYAFFRCVTFSVATASVTPPFKTLNGLISPSNSWATVYATVTNQLAPGAFANFVNSNGVGEYKIWNNAGTFVVTPQ
jgi:hypothetical protein